MIAKNIKGKGFAGCVRYVMNEGHELLEAEGVLADSAESITRSFAAQRSMRDGIAKPVGHIPISFTPEDSPRMTDDFMLQLAKEYMREMGIDNTQYIIVRHHNTENEHLHIVYNRIDNDLKLISVNNDYKRNIMVCKKLKDRHGLTYGKGKELVKREKLANPDKTKYKIYDAIKAVLPHCKNESDLKTLLEKSGIITEFKLNRTTGEVQGISFSYGNISFKGSEVDRKFSFGNLKKELLKNAERKAEREARQQKQVKEAQTATANTPKEDGLSIIRGVKLTPEQMNILKEGGFIYLENMTNSKGQAYSAYIITDDSQQRAFMFRERPDGFVKYGLHEMRLMDKRLIEEGYVTKAKVKYWGGGFAYPYLWKPGAVKGEEAEKLAEHPLADNSEYCQSWGDPRIAKNEKPEIKPRQPIVPKEKRGKKM